MHVTGPETKFTLKTVKYTRIWALHFPSLSSKSCDIHTSTSIYPCFCLFTSPMPFDCDPPPIAEISRLANDCCYAYATLETSAQRLRVDVCLRPQQAVSVSPCCAAILLLFARCRGRTAHARSWRLATLPRLAMPQVCGRFRPVGSASGKDSIEV
jgi:hypothetical protein